MSKLSSHYVSDSGSQPRIATGAKMFRFTSKEEER
jgi:hypothetical protein